MKTCKHCGNGIADEITRCPACGAPQEVVQPPKAEPAPVTPVTNPILYEYKNSLYNLNVFANRITTQDKRGGLMALAVPKRTDILLKNIAKIEVKGFTKTIQITMHDKTVHEIPFIRGKESEKLRDILLSLI